MPTEPNESNALPEDGGQTLTFNLRGDRELVVRVQIAMSTPVVPGVPPRPVAPGDTALAVMLDDEHMLAIQYGIQETFTSTPVVSGSQPPGNQN